MKTQVSTLEEEAKEKDGNISSLSDEVHNLKESNEQLTGDVDLLQAQADRVREEYRVKVEETMKKVKIAGDLWLTENTIKSYPNAAQFLEWFGIEDDDESSNRWIW